MQAGLGGGSSDAAAALEALINERALGTDRDFERYPLVRGHLTGSREGKPVAPLMGSITGYDGGATDLHIGPMTFGLAYCDHVVLYRFTPRGIRNTDCEITWLVNGSAVEGRDYDLAELTWLWDITTIADKQIIERKEIDAQFKTAAQREIDRVQQLTGKKN